VIAATAAGDTLWCRASGHAVVVASEPGDDEPGWTEVPDGSVVTATPRQVSVAPLTAPGNPASPASPVSPDQNTEDGRIAIR
jgi:glutamine amidotransferase